MDSFKWTGEGQEPLRWSSEWPFPEAAMDWIKAQVLAVHADYLDSDANDYFVGYTAIQRAFAAIAGELLRLGKLQEDQLDPLHEITSDIGIAAGWWSPASAERTPICSLRYGRYWVWSAYPQLLSRILSAEVTRCRANLLMLEREPAQSLGVQAPRLGSRKDQARSRRPVLESGPPLPKRAVWLKARLGERGWGFADPAAYGGPDRKTIQKILRGEPVRNDVLERLARALSKKFSPVAVLDIPNE